LQEHRLDARNRVLFATARHHLQLAVMYYGAHRYWSARHHAKLALKLLDMIDDPELRAADEFQTTLQMAQLVAARSTEILVLLFFVIPYGLVSLLLLAHIALSH
jgi:hypothetical protein